MVARTGSFTKAAQELHVSQSAVTRQVSVLEAYVGVELFRREARGVALTQAGRAYSDEVAPAFEKIAAATSLLMKRESPEPLRVMTYSTFSAKWLIPRLAGFMRRHPRIEIQIVNSTKDVDFDRDEVDLAIQYGDGRWPRVQTDLLLPDQIEPVCTPRYLAEFAGKGGQRPQALLARRLLVSEPRSGDWDDWLGFSGMKKHAAKAERMSFSTYALAWQAALDGLGITIGYSAQLEEELSSGRLVAPFANPLRRGKAYYLVRPLNQRESFRLWAFRQWLLELTKRSAA